MRCELIQPHLAAYIDGELDEALRAGVETHLEECRACRESERDMRLASAVLTAWRPADPSASMVDTLRRRAEDEQNALRRRERESGEPRAVRPGILPNWGRLAVAASVLIMLGAAALLWNSLIGPWERTPSETVAAIGRSTMKLKTIAELRQAQFALHGVIAEQWSSPRPDASALVQLEVVGTMIQTASQAGQGKDVGRILEMLGEEKLAAGAGRRAKELAFGAGDCFAALFAMNAASAEGAQGELHTLLDEAIALEEAGELEQAVAKFREASGDRLLALRSFIHQANLEMKLGRADEAAVALNKAYELTRPRTFNRELVIELKQRADRAIELRRKIEGLKAELLKTESDFDLLSEIGSLEVKAGNLKGAAETFDRMARTFDGPEHQRDRLRARLLKAWCDREMKQFSAAFDEFNALMVDAREVYPEVAFLAQFERAKTLHLRGRIAQAIDEYTDLASRSGIGPGCYAALEFQVGYIYLTEVGNPAEAARIFRRLQEKDCRSQPFGRLAATVMVEGGS